MGFSAGDSTVQTGASLARPLYRDDDDGMQALRLQHLLTTAPEIAERHKLIERMERAISVTSARWAAIPGGVRLDFGTEADLVAMSTLIAAEQECCSFFTFRISVTVGGTSLEVTAPPDGQAMIDELVGAEA